MLPPLRDELEIFEASSDEHGAPTWVIHDPVRNQFFQIDKKSLDVLSHWHLGASEKIIQKLDNVNKDYIKAFQSFLESRELVQKEGAKYRQSKSSWISFLLHRYLFFRIPLVRPDRFLSKTVKYVEPLYSKTVLYGLIIAFFLGLILLFRQWDVFLADAVDLFSLQGLIYFLIALAISKAGHELGHAYTAKRYGCRIPTMGVAFLVLWPMLYTDTNETWKLKSAKKRIAVASAGVCVELSFTVIATVLWSILPDGVLRDIALIWATTTWVTSLAINLSPFMRFDGYYLLSDWLKMPNLHARSFEFSKWHLRKTLFGLNAPKPEILSPAKTTFLIWFGYGVWIYRLILFLGIALLVYSFFIKIIGIILFFVEIAWFIARPIWRELKVWYLLRSEIFKQRRSKISASILLAGLLFFVWPQSHTIQTQAILKPEKVASVYTKISGKIISIEAQDGDYVKKGQTLLILENPDLLTETVLLQTQDKTLLLQQAAMSFDESLRIESDGIFAESAKIKSQLFIAEQNMDNLVIRAPVDGFVSGLDHELNIGQWVGEDHLVTHLKSSNSSKLFTYIEENDLSHLSDNGICYFYSQREPNLKRSCLIDDVAFQNSTEISHQSLTTLSGGDVTVVPDDEKLVSESPVFEVRLRPIDNKESLLEEKVIVFLESDRSSLAYVFANYVASLIMKEFSF